MATLADLVRKRRQSGGSVTSSLSYGLKEKFKEKIDPRKFLDQSGVLTALFPQLKAYKAGGKESPTGLGKSLTPDIIPSTPAFDVVETNTKIAAKNTLVLPAMHRDINVMRQNIIKLVKLKGGTPTNKADMYFMNARAQEAAYESRLKRGRPEKVEKKEEKPEEERGFLGDIKSLMDAAIAGTLGGVVKDVVASAASKLFPAVFSWASIPALGLALASQQAGEADLNNQQQGIIDPIKRAYEKAQNGDLIGVAEEIGNINVFTAAGRFGLEAGQKGYEEMGFKQKHEATRESNLDSSKDMSAGQSAAFAVGEGDAGVAKAISSMEKNIESEKDPVRKAALQQALDNYKQSYLSTTGKSPTPATPPPKPAETKVETPTPTPTPRNVAAVVEQQTLETKRVEEEVSNQPVINVIEKTEEKTVNAPPSGTGSNQIASVYDSEFLKLLGMGAA